MIGFVRHGYLGVSEGELADFLAGSLDYEMTPGLVERKMRAAGGFWSILKDGKPSGFFYGDVQAAEYGGRVGVVGGFYGKGIGRRGLRIADEVLGDWARENDAKELAFFTRRNPDAFCRALGNGWKVDSYVLKRAV